RRLTRPERSRPRLRGAPLSRRPPFSMASRRRYRPPSPSCPEMKHTFSLAILAALVGPVFPSPSLVIPSPSLVIPSEARDLHVRALWRFAPLALQAQTPANSKEPLKQPPVVVRMRSACSGSVVPSASPTDAQRRDARDMAQRARQSAILGDAA